MAGRRGDPQAAAAMRGEVRATPGNGKPTRPALDTYVQVQVDPCARIPVCNGSTPSLFSHDHQFVADDD